MIACASPPMMASERSGRVVLLRSPPMIAWVSPPMMASERSGRVVLSCGRPPMIACDVAADDGVRAQRPRGLAAVAADDRLGVAADDGVRAQRPRGLAAVTADDRLRCRRR